MALKLPVYLDNHATTMVDPRVVEAMMPYFGEHYGNAASKQHEYGWRAEAAVELARAEVASLIGAGAMDIVFTSGATESINLALKGAAEANARRGNHIITARTEHSAVLDTCKRLESQGFRLTYLGVDLYGRVALEEVRQAMDARTILVTIMTANNEIGTIAQVEEIGRLCRQRDVLFHTDATQAAGRIPLDVAQLQVDLMSFSAHKMYGPKGAGALYIRAGHPRVALVPQVDGGGHERGLRSGTVNVPAIVGFGKAAELARTEMVHEASRTLGQRTKLVHEITLQLDGIRINGHPVDRLPNNANITFTGTQADTLMMDMKDIAVSSGSACSSVSQEPSHVLKAIGLSNEDVRASLRFGLGRFTTEEEIDYTIGRLVETVRGARKKYRTLAHV